MALHAFFEEDDARVCYLLYQDMHQVVGLTDTMLAVLDLLENAPLSRKDIFSVLNMSDDSRVLRRIVEPLSP